MYFCESGKVWWINMETGAKTLIYDETKLFQTY